MSCEEILKRLDEDEETLSDPERRELRRHLETCERCGEELRRLEGAWDLLDEWADVEPSERFADGVMARIRADEACAEHREALVEANGVAQSAVLQRHLQGCARCRHDASALSQTWQMLGEWADVDAAPDFAAQVMQKVASSPRLVAAGSVAPVTAPRRLPSSRFLRSLATLAAAVAMVIGVFFLVQPAPPPGPPVLDQYVVSAFDAGRPKAVLDDLPVYVAADKRDSVLDDLKEPPAGADDDAIEEVLDARRHGEG